MPRRAATEEARVEHQVVRDARAEVMQIAAAGGDDEEILVGIRELPVRELRLAYRAQDAAQAAALSERLQALRLHVTQERVEEDSHSIFRFLAAAAQQCKNGMEVAVNLSSGPRSLGYGMLAGCFFLGLPAFQVVREKPQFMPILRLSYGRMVGSAKLRILAELARRPSHESLQSLASRLGMQKSLLSYHLRGSAKSVGMEELGLVEVDRAQRGRLSLTLTPLGRFVLECAAPAGERGEDVPRSQYPFQPSRRY